MTATIGDNAPTLPQDRSEASRVLYNRLKLLYSDRRLYGDNARDMLKHAKKETGISPRVVRLGCKLDRLTPEKREKWAGEMSDAAVLFGFSRLEVADNDRSGKVWQLVVDLGRVENSRREVSETIADLLRVARDRGDLEVTAIKKLALMSHRDTDDVADEWASIDSMATFLGIW